MRKLGNEYKIRYGEQLDIPALISLDRAASELFRPTGLIPDMSAIPESVPTDILAAAIANSMLLVVHDSDGVVGFSLCQQIDNCLYLDQLSVHPEHGRKGIGSALVKSTFKLAKDNKLGTIVLSTFRDIPWNGPFYRSLGFREIPRKKLTDWMLKIEEKQAETLDVSQRCFMIYQVRRAFWPSR